MPTSAARHSVKLVTELAMKLGITSVSKTGDWIGVSVKLVIELTMKLVIELGMKLMITSVSETDD